MATETIEVTGHIVDSLLLAKILDSILDAGCDYEIVDVSIGKTSLDPSSARIAVSGDDELLGPLLDELQVHGANRVAQYDARLVTAEVDGVLPAGFYSTTNLASGVRVDGAWLPVVNPEMDCGLVVRGGRAYTVPMHRVRAGDQVVVGSDGVRVQAPERARGTQMFEFMASEVSSEKPKALLVTKVAQRLREARARGGRVLVVAGPAVVHTGGAPDLARLVEDGWVDVLFAGNGFATHDIESHVLGTSLGVSVDEGTPTEGGHANHLRVINEVRRHGSIAAAVDAGFVTGGVMRACVHRGVPFVLGGSIRDDGPLPDVITDVVAAADAMRAHLDVLDQALAGPGTVDVDNDLFRVHNPLDITDVTPTPVLIAALGPIMLRIAGERTDGTILWLADERAIAGHIAPRITEAAEGAGRPAPRIVAGIPVCLCRDDEVDTAVDRANRLLSEAEVSPNYQRLLDQGDARSVGDILAAGSEAAIEKRLRAFADAGVTDVSVRVVPIGDGRDERLASMRRTRELLGSLATTF
ncbi:MAG: LLM class flavin-dependent oxidoreductase [Acidimicrobiales bacterium]|nr:LLM class flavin-dependent oxidoreductase [Acidimicrobiales bacterium]